MLFPTHSLSVIPSRAELILGISDASHIKFSFAGSQSHEVFCSFFPRNRRNDSPLRIGVFVSAGLLVAGFAQFYLESTLKKLTCHRRLTFPLPVPESVGSRERYCSWKVTSIFHQFARNLSTKFGRLFAHTDKKRILKVVHRMFKDHKAKLTRLHQ